MPSNYSKGVDNTINAFIRKVENMNTNQIDQINKDQYKDELDHKIKVYSDVMATVNLCRTMIVAIDATSTDETFNRRMLLSNLDLARTEALLSVMDVEFEQRGLGK